ncbi:F0F1 ATP synthase subunit B family protein [Granulicella tundricola]|uniref:ATP synthase subunit b n=1 Tax=Granulicella tundricola (strain ATCC BAA-1859 / DSM 23138 / MP5ACTX9) TaxID=1198114 RepID=E8X3M3_GRATM|nr:ATP synthase F0 subunit B [Granulicella tundricola]ADW68214.1 H+transporting two-sector ATPase B/B' subunit [Granulicella tundricola MP5ACTX9]
MSKMMNRIASIAALAVLTLGLCAPVYAQAMKADDSGRQTTPAANSNEANQGEVDETAEYKQSAVVKKLGGMMGMKPAQAALLFEVINFGILAVLVGGFLLKALPKAFRNRTTLIQKHLVDARTATEEASARMSSIEDRLAQLDGQIATMKTQAETTLAADEQRMKVAVEEETAKILASAEQEIAAATQHARKQLQAHAAELAIEQAARKLTISAETDRLLVQNFARRLAGDDVKGGQN